MKTLTQRIASRYMKRASIPDLMWGVDQLDGVATTLKDIVAVWEGQSTGTPGIQEEPDSLADVYGEIAKASKVIQGVVKTLEQQSETLRNVHSKPIPAVSEAKRAAAAPGRLDPKTKTVLNRALVKAGMGGVGRFEKAQHALSKALQIIGEVGIIADELVSSHHFSFPLGELGKGHFTVRLAFADPTGQDNTVPLTNTMLSFSFDELSKYRFEVIAYLS